MCHIALCLNDLSHYIPLVGIVGTATTCLGASLVLGGTEIASLAMHAIGFDQSAWLMENFHNIFVFTVLVDSLVLWLATANSYSLREYVFARMEPVFVRAYKRAIGREAFFVLLVLGASAFALALVFVFFMAPTIIFLELMLQGCQAGHTELDMLSRGLALSMLFGEYPDISVSMAAFCNSRAIAPRTIWAIGFGSVFYVLGQILVLTSVVYNNAFAFSDVPKDLKDEEVKLLDPKVEASPKTV
mmetsp:Transcript_147067/g.273888  ORF Transcript_147067/g.273888 Transcript_147067/m.273888 type:complete len:244 (-) Transcript_147067:108-839(-)